MKKVTAIIQARMGSTRLPGKVLMKLEGKTVLQHVIERVKQADMVNDIIIATTLLDHDNPIVEEATKCGVRIYRGSEDDVLSRYYLAAKENRSDVIVRITSDCPLIDPIVVDELVRYYLDNNFDIVTNAGADLFNRTYPRGLDTEVFSFDMLEEAYLNAAKPYQREHVTPYLYERSERVFYYKNNVDLSKYRWTLDTHEDFQLIAFIYKQLYKETNNFYMNDILELFDSHPEIFKINEGVEQKKVCNT